MQESTSVAPNATHHIVVLAIFAAGLSTMIALLQTSEAAPSPGLLAVGWIAAQSFVITSPGIAVVFLLQRYSSRMAVLLGSLFVLITPALMFVDAITFHWIGERFLSAAVWRAGIELRSGLLGYVSVSMIAGAAVLLVLGIATLTVTWWTADRIANRWASSESSAGPAIAFVACLTFAGLMAVPSLIDLERTRNEMTVHSSRHPLCVVGLVSFRGPGNGIVVAQEVATRKSLEQAVLSRDHQQRRVAVDLLEMPNRRLPDVLIVVVESFRRELVHRDVMPHLWRYAQQGVHCRAHFSGGNATNHGIFSLLNGLEAIWYERAVRYSPLLNRLFRQAGYELGFFAGHDDWRKFYMDGYISDEHFDLFETTKPSGLASDRLATQLASNFLERKDVLASDQHRPRLALLYLYATHATYNSYAEDQIFEPAADDRLLIPYSDQSQPQVWNRYKNSARTVDRFLASVLKDDRVIIVTGDHGESFLEDGTIGHGIRISEFQNMTPAVVFVPGQSPREIDEPTFHADLLPTLISATGIQVSDEAAFDGVDLLSTPSETLSRRLFVTRNYLRDDVAVIGPWTNRDDQPFAHRIRVSLREFHISAINSIDRRGNQQTSDSGAEIGAALKRWSDSRFWTREQH